LLAKHRKLMSTALERDARHGRLIMRPSLRELSGKLLAKHRKLMSTALERDARHGRLIMRPSLRELCSFAADPASWVHLGMCWSNHILPARHCNCRIGSPYHCSRKI
ncbi:hypothetical protein AB4Z51_45060, partial [Bradyrhizobium sp. 2TAF36]|uniref:hypothetical protein n=1 Tax=Bradyrhizobium sp. 2TAF36 TaxID=3233016 RepID=UPI003F8FA7EB